MTDEADKFKGPEELKGLKYETEMLEWLAQEWCNGDAGFEAGLKERAHKITAVKLYGSIPAAREANIKAIQLSGDLMKQLQRTISVEGTPDPITMMTALGFFIKGASACWSDYRGAMFASDMITATAKEIKALTPIMIAELLLRGMLNEGDKDE